MGSVELTIAEGQPGHSAQGFIYDKAGRIVGDRVDLTYPGPPVKRLLPAGRYAYVYILVGGAHGRSTVTAKTASGTTKRTSAPSPHNPLGFVV